MKIIPEIITLAKEHHQSLVLANKCINTVKNKSVEEIQNLCQEINHSFAKDWSQHFLIEENTIFQPLLEKNTPLNSIIKQLIAEHKTLLQLAKDLNKNNHLLAEFGLLLKTHTRLEDRELFPYLAQYLTAEQLQKIPQNND